MTLKALSLFFTALSLSSMALAEPKYHHVYKKIKVSCPIYNCNSPAQKEDLGQASLNREIAFLEQEKSVIQFISTCGEEYISKDAITRCEDKMYIVRPGAGPVSDPFFYCHATLRVTCNL